MKSFLKRNISQDHNIDTVFYLRGIDSSNLDKIYNMKDIMEVGVRTFKKPVTSDLKLVTTKLEHLGISKEKINPFESIHYNENCIIQLFSTIGDNGNIKEITRMKGCHCWYCKLSLSYNQQALCIPTKYIDNKFYGEGLFCSFNCIVAYMREYSHIIRYKNTAGLIPLLYYKLTNIECRLIDITPSPDWRLLSMFGGPLTSEEYKKAIQVYDFTNTNQYCQKQQIISDQQPSLIFEANVYLMDEIKKL